ncbi:hypothetical protein BH09BAC3_BH09BAC3_10990 [soil metagenome]
MKLKFFTTFAFSIITVLAVMSAKAQDNFSKKSAVGSIEGTSSLHDWKSEITDIQCKGLFEVRNGILKSIKSTEIKILVEGIKSTKGKTMNNKTYAAFRYKENPYILFTFTSGDVKTVSDNIYTIETTGTLNMAGETKKVAFKTKVNVLPNGDLQISASEKIKMTDYKMKKPTAVFGTITVGDEVNVNFNLVLTPATPQAKSK